MTEKVISSEIVEKDGMTFKGILTYINGEQYFNGYYLNVKTFKYTLHPVTIEEKDGYIIERFNPYDGVGKTVLLDDSFRISKKATESAIKEWETWINATLELF